MKKLPTGPGGSHDWMPTGRRHSLTKQPVSRCAWCGALSTNAYPEICGDAYWPDEVSEQSEQAWLRIANYDPLKSRARKAKKEG